MSNNIIEITCPKCRFEFETSSDMPCPRCGNPIVLPEPDIDIDEFLKSDDNNVIIWDDVKVVCKDEEDK